MSQERRRASRTTVNDVTVSIKEIGFFGKKIDKEAKILDLSSTGLGLQLNQALKPGKDYLLGFELHWLHKERLIQIRVMDCIPLTNHNFRVGVRIIRDEFCTISFIATAIKAKKRNQ